MEFAALLAQFGSDIGLDGLALDPDGRCALLFDGEHEVTFMLDRDDRSLILCCEVGELADRDREGCLELMQASLLGAKTGGSALSVHRASDRIVLWKRHDEYFQDVPALEQALNAFLAQVVHWKARLAGRPTAAVLPSSSLDQDVLNNLNRLV